MTAGGAPEKTQSISFAFRIQNIHTQTAAVSKVSPWVVKSTLLNSTKPESHIPTATTKWHLWRVSNMPSSTAPRVAQSNHLKTKSMATPGPKLRPAASNS